MNTFFYAIINAQRVVINILFSQKNGRKCN